MIFMNIENIIILSLIGTFNHRIHKNVFLQHTLTLS